MYIGVSNLPQEIIGKIVSYLNTSDITTLYNVNKQFYYECKRYIRKKSLSIINRIIINPVNEQEKEMYLWLINRNYNILYTIETHIENDRILSKELTELFFFYIEKKYIEPMMKNTLRIVEKIQKIRYKG
jgi:hypothetical protein